MSIVYAIFFVASVQMLLHVHCIRIVLPDHAPISKYVKRKMKLFETIGQKWVSINVLTFCILIMEKGKGNVHINRTYYHHHQ